jgi:hypothetical protein
MTAGSAQHEGEPGWFTSPQQVNQRRYEALRAYFVDGLPYAEAGARFGYTRWAMINLVREHRAGNLVLPDTQDDRRRDIRGERLETGIPGVDRRGGAHGVAGVLTVTGTRVPEAAWCSW